MALYTIADLHLSESAGKPMDVFGRVWENHREKLKEAWRASVCEDDTVVVPGDISWGMGLGGAREDLLFIDALPGKKIIGKGNHDYWWNTLTKLGDFLDEIGAHSISFLHNNAYLVEGRAVCGAKGCFPGEINGAEYEKLALREAGRLRRSLEEGAALVKGGGELMAFLHYPPYFGGVRCGPIADVLAEFGVGRCFYGHLHGVPPRLLEKRLGCTELRLVSADALRFAPLLIE